MPLRCEPNGLPDLPKIEEKLREACYKWNWHNSYKNYVWNIDTYEFEYPFIRLLEQIIPPALKSRNLNVGHLLAIKLWGAPDKSTIDDIRRNTNVRNAKEICRTIFKDNGKLFEDIGNNPEKPMLTTQRNCIGFGPTYSSKLLRFASPEEYGAIDTRIARYFGPNGLNWLPEIRLGRANRGYFIDSNYGWPISYKHWINILRFLAGCLNNERMLRCPYPDVFIVEGLRPMKKNWYIADVEMALFAIASQKQKEKTILQKNDGKIQPKRSAYAGRCPNCGSSLKWRRAQRTGELYRGCTNFPQCRWQDRSY